MKVQDFIKVMKGKMLKGAQLEEFVSKTLEVKKYIGIKEKKKLVDKIISECLYNDDGVFKFDSIDRYVYFVMYTIAAHTNLEFDDIYDDFDALSSAGLIEIIPPVIGEDYDSVNIFLEFKCDDIMAENTMQSHFTKLIAKIGDAVDNVGSHMPEIEKLMQKIK